jgi:pimeloyl-ACP methyl ester carboxylesterase
MWWFPERACMTDLATAAYRERTDALATVRGGGPDVVCFHGNLMDRTVYHPQVAALSDDYRVASVDFRARTDLWQGPYGIPDLVEDALAAMDGLGMDDPVFVGTSMGGFTGLRLAIEHPDRLAGLVLVDSMAEPHTEAEREQYAGMADQLRNADAVPRSLAEAAAHFLFGPTTFEQRPGLPERWIDRWTTYHPQAVYHEVYSWLERPGTADRLDELSVPALVLHGEEDQSIAPERAAPVAEAAPDGRTVTIPDCGHTPTVEAPEATSEALRSFLEEVA